MRVLIGLCWLALCLPSATGATARPAPAKGPYVAGCMAKLPMVNLRQRQRGQPTYSDAAWRSSCRGDYAAAAHMSAERPYDASLSCFPLVVSRDRCRQLLETR